MGQQNCSETKVAERESEGEHHELKLVFSEYGKEPKGNRRKEEASEEWVSVACSLETELERGHLEGWINLQCVSQVLVLRILSRNSSLEGSSEVSSSDTGEEFQVFHGKEKYGTKSAGKESKTGDGFHVFHGKEKYGKESDEKESESGEGFQVLCGKGKYGREPDEKESTTGCFEGKHMCTHDEEFQVRHGKELFLKLQTQLDSLERNHRQEIEKLQMDDNLLLREKIKIERKYQRQLKKKRREIIKEMIDMLRRR